MWKLHISFNRKVAPLLARSQGWCQLSLLGKGLLERNVELEGVDGLRGKLWAALCGGVHCTVLLWDALLQICIQAEGEVWNITLQLILCMESRIYSSLDSGGQPSLQMGNGKHPSQPCTMITPAREADTGPGTAVRISPRRARCQE